MKILANENVPLASVDYLSAAGFDIISLSRLSPGIDDKAVLQMAREQGRILITFDRDYGELNRQGRDIPFSGLKALSWHHPTLFNYSKLVIY